jgi:DNA-binding SARP family transcriptional activator
MAVSFCTVTCMPPRPSAPRLDIRLLGPPEVAVDGQPLRVDTRKAVAILALLAADDRAYARDELAALLWPESDDTAAHGALRRTLSVMRAGIDARALRIERARIWLDGAHTRIDLREVERLASRGSPTDLAAAAALARGPFLAGFNLRDSPEFDDWRAARSVSIERLVLGVLDRLGAAAQASGDLAGAIAAAARRLDLDPLDEGAHARLMELYGAAGDRAAAVRQYRACVAVLERELGVAPLAATTARYEAIRDAAPTPVVPERSDRPRADTAAAPAPDATDGLRPLVGRDEVLARIDAALAATADDRQGRVIALTGEAGIGKSHLGDAVAQRVRGAGGTVLTARGYRGEAAIAYGGIVDLLRAAQRDPIAAARLDTLDASVLTELARLVPTVDPGRRRTRPQTASDTTAHARLIGAIVDGLAFLVEGRTPGLLWLDDAHWLDGATLEAIGVLARRLSGRPLVILVTWREEDVPVESAVALRALADASGQPIVLPRLTDAAVAALVEQLGPDGLSDAERGRIGAASEGLPLYIVGALAMVGAGTADPAPIPPGVRAVLRSRLDAIDETGSQVLAAAAIIGRTFDIATVRHASGRSEEETVDALDRLSTRAIVRDGPAGYDFTHGALRDLVDEGIGLARRRLLHQRVAEALRLDVGGLGRDDLGRWTGIAIHERDAGRTEAAAEAYREAATRAAQVFANQAVIEHAGAALALGHPDGLALHTLIGRARTRLGDYDGAVAAFEAAAARASEAELPGIELAIGRARLRRGDLAGADRHLATVADDATAPPAVAARAWVDRSVIRRRAGDVAAASDAARRALAIAVQAGDDPAIGAARRMLGLSALDAGDAVTARAELTRALDAAEADPDPTSRIAALVGLAMAAGTAGETDAAIAHGRRALDACRRIGDRHLEAAVEDHIADLLHAAGRDDDAREHQRRAAAAFAELGGGPADPDPGIWMLAAW